MLMYTTFQIPRAFISKNIVLTFIYLFIFLSRGNNSMRHFNLSTVSINYFKLLLTILQFQCGIYLQVCHKFSFIKSVIIPQLTSSPPQEMTNDWATRKLRMLSTMLSSVFFLGSWLVGRRGQECLTPYQHSSLCR